MRKENKLFTIIYFIIGKITLSNFMLKRASAKRNTSPCTRGDCSVRAFVLQRGDCAADKPTKVTC